MAVEADIGDRVSSSLGANSSSTQVVTSHPLNNGRLVGELPARSQTSDVVDAHLALTAHQHGLDIVTGDPNDLTLLANLLPSKPRVHAWP